MADCLVTRLRASVADASLKKLGVLAVTLAATNKSYIVNLAGKDVVATIIGDGYFMNTQNTNLGKTIALSEAGSAYWYSASSPIVVEFKQKYGLTKINFAAGDESLQTLDEFDYMSNLVELQGVSIKENLDVVDKTYNIQKVSFATSSQVSGKVESFARIFPNLTNIGFSNGDNGSATLNIQGDIKDMIAQFISQGRTTGTIKFNASYRDVKTFFGALPQATASINDGDIHWDSAEKAYMTNPATKKVYAHGYTESEHSGILANYAGYEVVKVGA
jgi:hypothetical protein